MRACRCRRRRTPPGSASPSARARPARIRARTGSDARGRAPRRAARHALLRTRARSSARARARTRGRSSCAQAACELGDQPDAIAGAAALPEVVRPRPREKPGSGHVDVGPGTFAGELLQELGGQYGNALAKDRGVLHVGVRRVDVAPEAVVQRPRPRVVAARLTRSDYPVAPVGVVAEDTG